MSDYWYNKSTNRTEIKKKIKSLKDFKLCELGTKTGEQNFFLDRRLIRKFIIYLFSVTKDLQLIRIEKILKIKKVKRL